MNIREIRGASFEGGVARMLLIESRERAQDHQCFFAQLTRLYGQLTDRTPAKNMHQLVGDRLRFIFVVNGTNLIASVTFVLAKTSTICKGLIEDLVVDEPHRKEGLAKILLEEAIKIGARDGCHYAQLTGKPGRSGASQLYVKAGFDLIAMARVGHPEATNLYRFYYRRH